MAHGIITSTARHTSRRMRVAMQGDPIRALVEFITNCDDSLRIMEQKGQNIGEGRVDIIYGEDKTISVRDFAQGMSAEKLANNFEKYGAASSGLFEKEVVDVRGFFGQGAKDALGGMKDGKIRTIKDDEYSECSIYIEDEKPHYIINEGDLFKKPLANGSIRATNKIRKELGILKGNGTVASFKCVNHTPRPTTIHEELSNNYMLRTIMTNSARRVMMVIENGKTTEKRIRYKAPKNGKLLVSENFDITYEGRVLPISFQLLKAPMDLTQKGDDRIGGLLIQDDSANVLDLSLFKFDNESLASSFYGDVIIHNFVTELLLKKEAVLSDERRGLLYTHPFNALLIAEIEKRLEVEILKIKSAQQVVKSDGMDKEECYTYQRVFSYFNELHNEICFDAEIDGATGGGGDGCSVGDTLKPPENGMALYPPKMNPTVGSRYIATLTIDTKAVHHGDIINIKCSNSYIVVTPAQITITKLDGTGVLRKYLNIFCDEVNSFGFLEVSSTNCNGKVSRATADIHIAKPEGYRRELKEYGLVFDHENLTVKPGKARTISLVGYVPKIPDGSKIRIQVMDKSKDLEDEIDISPKTITFNHDIAEKGICKYDVSITGYGEGNKISIHASAKDPDGDELPGVETLMEVQVSSQATGGAGSGTGAFGVPEFNDKTDPLHPIGSSKDAGTEKLIIYTEYPTTKYLLKNGRKTLEAKIKIADLICRFTFRQLAEQKVLSSGLFTDFASRFNKVEGVAEELERLHGKKIMEMMIGAI